MPHTYNIVLKPAMASSEIHIKSGYNNKAHALARTKHASNHLFLSPFFRLFPIPANWLIGCVRYSYLHTYNSTDLVFVHNLSVMNLPEKFSCTASGAWGGCLWLSQQWLTACEASAPFVTPQQIKLIDCFPVIIHCISTS